MATGSSLENQLEAIATRRKRRVPVLIAALATVAAVVVALRSWFDTYSFLDAMTLTDPTAAELEAFNRNVMIAGGIFIAGLLGSLLSGRTATTKWSSCLVLTVRGVFSGLSIGVLAVFILVAVE